MQLPRILKIKSIEGFTLSCIFNNGETRVIDFRKLFRIWKVTKKDPEYLLLKENELSVTVKGFASKDGNPVRNATLSKMRANYVKNELIKRGVKSSNIKHEGVGDSEELYDNTTNLKSKNRTVRIAKIN